MKTSIFLIMFSAILLLLSSCQKQNAGSELRSPGEIAFKSNCQTCHILPKPTIKTDLEWPAMVSRYGEKAKLTQTQIKEITAFLISHN